MNYSRYIRNLKNINDEAEAEKTKNAENRKDPKTQSPEEEMKLTVNF